MTAWLPPIHSKTVRSACSWCLATVHRVQGNPRHVAPAQHVSLHVGGGGQGGIKLMLVRQKSALSKIGHGAITNVFSLYEISDYSAASAYSLA